MSGLRFQPSDLPRLTSDLASPDLTLREVADRHHTTLDALTLYLTSPQALEHIATLELASAVRVRLAATIHLTRAVHALQLLLQDYTDSAPLSRSPGEDARKTLSAGPRTGEGFVSPSSYSSSSRSAQASSPFPSPNLRSELLDERKRQNARRAAHLIFRLATFSPRPLAGLRAPDLRAPGAGASACPPLSSRVEPLKRSVTPTPVPACAAAPVPLPLSFVDRACDAPALRDQPVAPMHAPRSQARTRSATTSPAARIFAASGRAAPTSPRTAHAIAAGSG